MGEGGGIDLDYPGHFCSATVLHHDDVFSHFLHLQCLAIGLFNLVIVGFYPINCVSLMQTPFVYLCVAVCAKTCVLLVFTGPSI